MTEPSLSDYRWIVQLWGIAAGSLAGEPWLAAIWGLVGGLCVEALELYALIRNTPQWSWRKPIPQGLAAYLISVVVRVGVGAALAAAAAGSGQVSGTLAAFGLGVAAPLVIEKLAQNFPLEGTPVTYNRRQRPPGDRKASDSLPRISDADYSDTERTNPSAKETDGSG